MKRGIWDRMELVGTGWGYWGLVMVVCEWLALVGVGQDWLELHETGWDQLGLVGVA